MSIVFCNGTFVNRLTTSNEIILYPLGTLLLLIFLMKSLVLSTVYEDFPSGASNLHKYRAVLCVAVPMFETIGLIGSFSNLSGSFVFTLCILAVP